MGTAGQSLFATGQPPIGPYETAPRPVVGFAHDYPAGYATPEHAHPRAQLLYAVSGVMRIATPGAAFLVPPGTAALFLPADAPHGVRMDGPVAMRTLFLREDAAARVGAAEAAGPAVLAVSPLLREVILAACAEPLHREPGGRGHLLAELALDEIARAAALPLRLPMPRDPRLRRAAAALQARRGHAAELEDLAALAGASARTLARLFRAETGLSFRQWRQQARLTEAMGALTTGASPARAAAVAGYTSQATFGAGFRALFGVTPGQARRPAPPAEAAPAVGPRR